MKHDEFKIGRGFLCEGNRWRCTDVGSRVIVAIRVDEVHVATMSDAETTTRVLRGTEVESDGWLSGPPYAVLEHVFDEDSMIACEPEPSEDDVAKPSWTDRFAPTAGLPAAKERLVIRSGAASGRMLKP